jgi:hypothetical protein
VTEPARVRRPVSDSDETPESPNLRRGCVVTGAVLGILVGALVAFFVVPPLFDHYFGTADVELGKRYEHDGRAITVMSVDEYTAGRDGKTRLVSIDLKVEPGGPWKPDVAGFRLHLKDGLIVQPVAPIEKIPVMFPDFTGETRPLSLLYAVPESHAPPDYIEVPGFRAHFHLQPGKPE